MIDFLKSQCRSFVFTVIIAGSVILFYCLKSDGKAEWVYPSLLALFFYVIYLVIEGIHYQKLQRILSLGRQRPLDQGEYSGVEYHLIADTMNAIHRMYLDEASGSIKKNQEFQRFIAESIHQIKLPVTVIRLITEDLKAADPEPEMGETIQKIARETDKISDRLNQVLNLYRLQEFEKDFIVESIDLHRELNGVINAQKDLFIYHGIYPRFIGEVKGFQILTDAKWHRVILTQLISNAVKYSSLKEDAKEVCFELKKSGEWIELRIIDQGIGIEEWDLKRIFQPFFTGENGRKTGNSSGIGLYIAGTLAKSLHHELILESEPGVGTKAILRYLTKM